MQRQEKILAFRKALKNSMPEQVLRECLDAFTPEEKAECFTQPIDEEDGNNLLHIAALNCSLSCILREMLDCLDQKKAIAAILSVNARGVNLIKMCEGNINSKNLLAILHEKLKNHDYLKPLNSLINLEDLLKNPVMQKNQNLIRNICAAANIARIMLLASNTHSDSKLHTLDDISDVGTCIEELRTRIKAESKAITQHRAKKHFEMFFSNLKKLRKGNCQEFSYLLVKILNLFGIPAEIFKCGNHVFVVINRKHDSDPKNYKTWGENAFICDAFCGEIFPAAEVPQRLKYYYGFECAKTQRRYNAYWSVNLECKEHQLEEVVNLKVQNWALQSNAMTLHDLNSLVPFCQTCPVATAVVKEQIKMRESWETEPIKHLSLFTPQQVDCIYKLHKKYNSFRVFYHFWRDDNDNKGGALVLLANSNNVEQLQKNVAKLLQLECVVAGKKSEMQALLLSIQGTLPAQVQSKNVSEAKNTA